MKKIFGFILLLISLSAAGQIANVEFKKGNFPGDQEGFEKAMQALAQGEQYFSYGPSGYEQALRFLLEANRFNPNNSDLNYKIGTIYNAMGLKGDAANYFKKAGDLNPKFKKDSQKLVAESYHLDMQWDNAINEYADYLNTLTNEMSMMKKGKEEIIAQMKDVEKRIKECENGKKITKDTVKIVVSNLGRNINTKYPEYSAVVTMDEKTIYFTSRRSTTTGGGIPPGDVFYYEDVYYCKKDTVDNKWIPSRQVPGKINTPDHDASVAISRDGKKMIICRPKSNINSDLYESTFNGTEWSEPVPLEGVNSKYRETHATYTPDGKTIYFVSNSPDLGAKGLDIFMSSYNEMEKNWSTPIPVNELNTEYNEDCIFMDFDGTTLYFSSEGHNTMGGYDIFRSDLVGGKPGKPVNMGYPVNTPANDIFYVATSDGKRAYFNSARKGGFGSSDIYLMTFISDIKIKLNGKAFDEKSGNTITDAKIQIEEKLTKKALSYDKNTGGEYECTITPQKLYKATVTAKGYEDYTEIFESKAINMDSLFMRKDFPMKKIQSLTLKGKVYDSRSKSSLDALLLFSKNGADRKMEMNADKSSGYSTTVAAKESYTVSISVSGYDPKTETVVIQPQPGQKEIIRDFYMSKGGGVSTEIAGISVRGGVYDKETGEKLNSTIKILNELGEVIKEFRSTSTEGFKGQLETNIQYFATITSDNYNMLEERFKIIIPEGETSVEKNFYLEKPFSNRVITIRNIYFDFDKFNLKPEAVKELINIVDIVKEYGNCKIELFAHCDIKGTYDYNVNLSIKRAKAAYDWLFEKGVSKNNMRYSYYSFSKPAVSNTKADGSDDPEARALNRRVEIRVYDMNPPKPEDN
jgi:outer membrane protein OmpA-like peptidoglycan-associated protein